MPRTTGARNKNKQALIRLLQEKYPGYQPVMDMAEAAIQLSTSARIADPEHAPPLWRDASAAHDRVAQYVTPKLKAVEVTGADGGPIQYAELSDEELEAHARKLAAEIGITGGAD